ncbi:MAG: DedA family protein [Prevotella sp.]|nr:DedA family protein [Prevotella sp.]
MDWLSALLDNLTYPVIGFLMMLESTVVPIPSELVVAPAAYHAANGEQNVLIIILVSTVGADLGATINYLVAYYLGRPIIYRFANSRLGKLCLLNEAKLVRAEQYFNRHGMVATITGRLIVGIRHLISLPAGLAKMNYPKFLLYTTVGATAWHAILALLGWYLHAVIPEEQLKTTIELYGEYIKLGLVAIVLILLLVALFKYYAKKRKGSL